MIIVINKNQGVKSLIKDLEIIYNIKNKGFYVIYLKTIDSLPNE